MSRSTGPQDLSIPEYLEYLKISRLGSEEKDLGIRKWIQRDIEDQILEEKQQKMSNNVPVAPSKVKIKTSEVVADLKKGLTRYKKDDKGYGSIQEKYGLSLAQTRKLFKDPKLVGKRSAPKASIESFEVVEDEKSIDTLVDEGKVTVEDAINQKEALFS